MSSLSAHVRRSEHRRRWRGRTRIAGRRRGGVMEHGDRVRRHLSAMPSHLMDCSRRESASRLLASGRSIFAASGDPWCTPAGQPQDALALVGLALVPGMIALTLYYRGLRRTTASAATLTGTRLSGYSGDESLLLRTIAGHPGGLGVIILVAAMGIGLRRNARSRCGCSRRQHGRFDDRGTGRHRRSQ